MPDSDLHRADRPALLPQNERNLQRRLLPSMAERGRLGVILLGCACVVPLVVDWFGETGNGRTMGAIELARVLMLAAIAAWLSPSRGAFESQLALMGGSILFAASAAWIGVLRADLGPYMIITVAVTLGASVALPWTVPWQASMAAMFSTGFAGALLVMPRDRWIIASTSSVFAYGMTMASSLLLASLDTQRRRATVEALDQTLRAGEALRDLNDSLEKRVAERTRDLADANHELGATNIRLATMNRDLEAAYRELEGFTHSVSHDLRVPLRVIHGLSRLTLDEHGRDLGEEGRAYLQRIGDAAIRLGEIGDDLLTLARVSRAPIVVETVDLGDLARDIVADLRRAWPGRRVVFGVQDGLTVPGDAGLLRVVLEHLVANSWKFTRQRDEAEIAIGPFEDGDQAGFFVRDNGSGFAPEFAGKLFRPFERIHDDTGLEGRGIGLAIAHRIVSRHGGRIHAEGEAGKGATFRVTFPRP